MLLLISNLSALTKRFVLCSVLVLSIVYTGVSQASKMDSLIQYVDTAQINKEHLKNLLTISYNYTYSTPDKALPYLTKADSIAELIDADPRTKGVIELYHSILFMELADYQSALSYATTGIEIFRSIDMKNYQGISLHHRGKVYTKLNRDDLAQKSFIEAEKIFQEIDDKAYLGQISLSLGNVNFRIGTKDKAYEYFKKAREQCKLFPSTNCYEIASNNIAVYYTSKKMPEEALNIYNDLEKLYLEKGNESGLAFVYYNIAEVWDELYDDDIKSAEYSKKALDLRIKLKKNIDLIQSRLDYGRNLVRLKQYQEAQYHINEGLSLSEKINDVKWISQSHRSLAQLYESTGDFEKAYFSMKIHKELRDTIKSQELISQIADADIKYTSAQKEKEIALLESEKALSDQTLSNQKRIISITVVGLLLFAVLSLFLYRLFRQNREQKNALQQAVKDKDYLLREIHHRVKNNLQVISSLLYLQSEKLTDPAAQDAINVGRGRVKSMALIHQNLYGVNQTSDISLQKYLEDLSIELFDSYNVRGQEIQLETDIEDTVVDVDILIPLGLIINELISNSLKYAFDNRATGVIKVVAKQDAKSLSIMVMDNGIGIDNLSVKKASFGTELIESFVSQLNAEMKIDSLNGTAVNITIPYKRAA